MPRAATANRTIRARTRRVLCILTVIFTFLTLGFAGASTFGPQSGLPKLLTSGPGR